MLKTIFIFITIALASSLVNAEEKHNERWYQEKYCTGVKEFTLSDNTRIDCLTDRFAIEFDWGKKWAECIGQAQYYAREVERLAGCVLITDDPEFIRRLLRGFDGAVWVANERSLRRVR